LYSIVDTLTKGTSVKVVGDLVPSPAAGQPTELRAGKLEVLGPCDGKSLQLSASFGLTRRAGEALFGLLLVWLLPSSTRIER
jgi:aspartyl/asparaginyl-tRNA synthetase